MQTKSLLLVSLLLLAGAAGATQSERAAGTLVDAAWAAYERGDYAEAAAGFKRLAEDGVVTAQLNLGYMYAEGQGVPVDLKESAYWLRRAAENGHVGAQMTLGLYYYNGEGVEKDIVAAHAWFTLAAAGGDARAGDYQALADREMSPEQLEAAHRLVKQLYARHGERKNLW